MEFRNPKIGDMIKCNIQNCKCDGVGIIIDVNIYGEVIIKWIRGTLKGHKESFSYKNLQKIGTSSINNPNIIIKDGI